MTHSSNENEIRKIAVVGNIAGGKTRLSQGLARIYHLPLFHVDSIQYLHGLKRRLSDECCAQLIHIESQKSWLIDGYGPFDLIENRFLKSDRVILIDLPIWQHTWWLTKRVFKSLFKQRNELPENCKEFNFAHIKRLYTSMWRMHQQMRPEILKILARGALKNKVVIVRNTKEWRRLYLKGIDADSD